MLMSYQAIPRVKQRMRVIRGGEFDNELDGVHNLENDRGGAVVNNRGKREG